MVKVLPKNYGIDEIIGSYLIELSSGSFALGLSVMITIRIISLISTLILFTFFNAYQIGKVKKFVTK
jgi:phosphatidylglycerophosphatase A